MTTPDTPLDSLFSRRDWIRYGTLLGASLAAGGALAEEKPKSSPERPNPPGGPFAEWQRASRPSR
jgi:hypothetical protein